MSERRIWTQQEDKIIINLVQVRGLKKWSQISKVLLNEFGIMHRNGKQCRQRYLNHLASGLKKGQWTQQQEDNLIKLHNQFGNKWAKISRHFQGRTDNCVKNQLYSKLRKTLRFVNDFIEKNLKKKFKQLKINFIYKLIQTADQKYESHPACKSQAYQQSYELKNKILKLQCSQENPDTEKIVALIVTINQYNKKYKKRIPKRKLMKNDSNSSSEQSEVQEQVSNQSQKMQKNQVQRQKKMPQTQINIKILQPSIQQQMMKQKQNIEMAVYQEGFLPQRIKHQFKIVKKGSNQSNSSRIDRLHTLSIQKQSAFLTIANTLGNARQDDMTQNNYFFNKVDPFIHGQQNQLKVKTKRSSSNQEFPNILVDGTIGQVNKCARLRSFGSIQAAFESQNLQNQKPSSIQKQFLNKQEVQMWFSNVQ